MGANLEQYSSCYETAPKIEIQEKITESLLQIFLKQDSYLDIDTLINEMKRI